MDERRTVQQRLDVDTNASPSLPFPSDAPLAGFRGAVENDTSHYVQRRCGLTAQSIALTPSMRILDLADGPGSPSSGWRRDEDYTAFV